MEIKLGNKKTVDAVEIIFLKKLDKKSSYYNFLEKSGFKIEKNSICFNYEKNRLYIGFKSKDKEDLKISIAKAIKEIKKTNFSNIFITLKQDDSLELDFAPLVEGILLSDYEFNRYKKSENKKLKVTISYEKSSYEKSLLEKELEKVKNICSSVNLVRDIVNTPPDDYYPEIMANDAKAIAKKENLKCKIIDEDGLEKLGMNAMLSVGRASRHKSKLIHLTYKPKNPKAKIVLIGKGLTYDSGGLSLKGAESMVTMKCDKAGGSAILGIMNSLNTLNLDCEVHGIIGAVENMIGGDAYKPDDVLTAKNGKTIEVKNTDAEGRLVLADCLCYAQDEIKDFNYIFDFATLTGACIVALGNHTSALLGHNEKLKTKIKKAADETGELVASLPYNRYFQGSLNSEIADMVNTAASRSGGSITASLFLDNFIEKKNKKKWVHFDIAGPAFVHKPWGYNPYGASGAGVRLMLKFIEDLVK